MLQCVFNRLLPLRVMNESVWRPDNSDGDKALRMYPVLNCICESDHMMALCVRRILL